MEKYENAIICFKYMLALAWTCKSIEAELMAYEGLAAMHLYLGNIQKVKFYDARVTYGAYEPESQGYTITVSAMQSQHPWLKEVTTKKLEAKGHLVGIKLA